ncbi:MULTISPECIES: class I SAM-dependent methyltransferase [Halorussus]|uniref:class I SAM-dependent methyltransferase n=1 Tax=Halorussus TaxID=1070314 RepID=UPI00209D25F0|nr:methyltransferase domain-containing protein [Halorussus vallis]USZ76522.1 methyltransferase domain-containing protein [Halorussus vallis]
MSDRERPTTGWQLDRNAPAAYEAYLVPRLFAPRAERLVDRVGVRDGDTVLDAGCGTGIVARLAASRASEGGAVVGLDVNEGMLDVAREADDEDRPPIEWRRGDATDLPFPDGSFDVVLCQQALQFFPDPVAALREMRRVLTPEGRVGIDVWRPVEFNPGYVELADVLSRSVGDDAEETVRSPFPAWNGDDLRRLAREAGFDGSSVVIEIVSVRYPSAEEFVRQEVASSPLSESFEDVGRDDRAALVGELEAALREYTDDEGVVFPMESHVLVARR